LQIIREVDPKLDDRAYINSLYDHGQLQSPKNFKFEWDIDALDLRLFDRKNNVLFCLKKGHI
jgi:hypothetical protein